MTQPDLIALPERRISAAMDFEDIEFARMILVKLQSVGAVCKLIPNGGGTNYETQMKRRASQPLNEINYDSMFERILIQGSSEEQVRKHMMEARKLINSYKRMTGDEPYVRYRML